ncbi:AbrB/MazE/SpoVT family DNA-binding domain-containing protein [Virgibacillus dakarensis]|uniref:AbrB/MazE/SpoVT family DNA-binding domain-containing protein n=1 Tax=Virgibacillus dakarensis TaxID=1917889 RepID=UPI000B44A761|nr:AbrB/MazE/SpoVT family DNA-binding domain-containing protein [Virgibacillus dakarensis]
MIATGKRINMDCSSKFLIPVKWRRMLQIEEGNLVKFTIENNHIFVLPSKKNSIDIISTVGRGGGIYIPKEVRDYFYRKGISAFHVHINEEMKEIIIKPEF